MRARSHEPVSLTLDVRVVPRASRTEIVGSHDGALKIRIAAPPVDGAANEELIRLLAKSFSVPRSAVTITGGSTSKQKRVIVAGASPEDLDRILNAK